jgi:iron(III) transport system ATP-binding protein
MSVELVNVTKVFTDHDHNDREFTAVDSVNIKINDGEMVTFLGPSGCGKTTTLRIISGFETQTSGDVYIAGKLVNDLPANKRDTSMVFQSYAIFPHLSVRQNIGFGLELKGMKKEVIRTETDKIMEIMGLSALGNRQPSQLSGGQQQRVALARAIVNKPKVLLFDEPLSNLDAKLREQMRTEIRRIQKQFGITSIYVTHDQSEAMTVSDRIMVMDKGHIRQIGTPVEIYSRPRNYFVADFIGRANFIEAQAARIREDGIEISTGGISRVYPSWEQDIKAGDQVYIVVRPEGLSLSSGNQEGAFCRAAVSQAVYQGSTMEYELCSEDQKEHILAVSHNPILEGFYKEGDTISISFNPISAHVIPKPGSQSRPL